MKYYVIYLYQKAPVCGTWITANNRDEAYLSAEFKLMCMLPNVQYDDLAITEEKQA